MKKGFVLATLCALVLAVPAAAERFYVPVLGTTAADGSALATKIWVGGERVAAGDALENSAGAEKARLIAVDTNSVLDVSARLVGRGGVEAEVPVFSEQELYAAGTDVPLGDLPGRRAMASLLVGAANLSEQAASCKATLFGRGDRQLAEIPFEVEPMSLARESAAKWVGRVDAVRVTCDQSFYPFGVSADESGLSPVFAKGVGPNGACKISLMLVKQSNGHYITSTAPGVFHEATKASPKGIVCIRTPQELRIAKAVYEWDVFVGPWSTRDRSGLHNLAYFFLDRYRSGVVGNVNAAGPNKSFLKVMQNVGMGRGTNTNEKVGYLLLNGATYHFVYTFDAEKKVAILQAFLGGLEVKRFSLETRPGGQQLMVRPYGKGESQTGLAMVGEFGNYLGQHHPEEATIGFKYLNFKLDMTPK